MSEPTVRAAFAVWPVFNERLVDRVRGLSEADLAIRPAADRWPIWASIGHLACQRVFGLSDVAREPGADTTPFPNAGFDCPGDDDLVNVRSSAQLVTDLVSTFAIVERRLDTWTLPMLEELIPHPEWPDREPETRGWTLQRCFAHDVSHMTELNEALTRAGLAQVDLWS